jgi:glycosyltransferase involved in cell wall biosynthesis
VCAAELTPQRPRRGARVGAENVNRAGRGRSASEGAANNGPVIAAILSKAFVHEAYRGKCDALAALPDTDAFAIVPPSWDDRGGWHTPLEVRGRAKHRLIETAIAFNGHYHVHFYPHLGRVLDELQPDVLHVDEEPFNLATVHAMSLAKRRGIPTTFFTLANIRRRLPPPFSLFEQACYRWSPRAIAASADAAAVLESKGYAKPIDVIPQFGIDPDLFRPADGRPERPFTIGYVGRLAREKGVHVLVSALARTKGDWRLLVVGEGREREELRRQVASARVDSRVEFRPPVPSTRVPEVLRGVDALVLPSLTTRTWKEQFGRVLVEAMSCGVPVVGSSSGEIPSVIGDAGIITPEGDAGALAEALTNLVANPAEHARLAERGRRRVVERYTHAAIAAQYRAAYDRLVGSS